MRRFNGLLNKLLLIIAAVGALAMFFMWIDYEYNKPPSYDQMKQYRIAHMADEDIRKARREAEAESKADWAEFRKKESKWKAEEDKKRSELYRLCDDIAYKEKHSYECTPPSTLFTGGPDVLPSVQYPEWDVETIYNNKILGQCLNVETRDEAKEKGCIDPDY